MKYAKLPFSKLIEPAIDLAAKGFAITEQEAGLLNSHKQDFLKHNKNKIAFVKDQNWKAGDLLIQPELAETLKGFRKWERRNSMKEEHLS
jgi:gamma-glutamyltranspeptidase/glutathione hydrolase